MITIKFIEHDSKVTEVEAEVGTSVMQAASDNAIAGIVAECGGCCSCATCRCYLHEDWVSKIAPAEGMEKAMLECEEDERPHARLSCQVTLNESMNGMTVYLPENQY